MPKHEVIEWVYQAPQSYLREWKEGILAVEKLEKSLEDKDIHLCHGPFLNPEKVKIGHYNFLHEGEGKFVLLGPGKTFDTTPLESLSEIHEGKHVLTRYCRGLATRYIFEGGICVSKETASISFSK